MKFPIRVTGLCLMIAVTNLLSVMGQEIPELAMAAEKHDLPRVRQLLKTGRRIDASLPDGTTALHWLAWHDETELVQQLLQAGADANSVSRHGATPLFHACQNGNAKIVECLLEAGANPNSAIAGGETALMTAARTGDAATVKVLLQRGAIVDVRERRGQTALMWAAAEGNLEAVELLLQAHADAQVKLASGFTAFFFAVRQGKSEVALRLLRAGVDIHDLLQEEGRRGPESGVGSNGLLLAVENGHFELAAALLDEGTDPNSRPAGFTALHAITWVRKPIRGDGNPPPDGSGNLTSLDLVRKLVAAGADVNVRLERGTSGRGRLTTSGATPFLLAARTADVNLLKLLLELGADPDIPNADQTSSLLAASGVGALGDGDEAAGTEAEVLATIALLLELGADVNAVDQNGETAMHGASYQSWPAVIRQLAMHDAKIDVWNRPNKWGWTPLMIAEGHRPGNFRPAPDTIVAIREVMLSAGVEPPREFSDAPQRNDYSSDNKPQRAKP